MNGSNFVFIIILFILLLSTIIKVILFRNTTYFKITHNGYFSTVYNVGRHGEYLSYKQLRRYEKIGGKFLFNVYLPKDNGETTEIDVLLICSKGVFVIESKNYSGWIFGNESKKMWTQTLPQGRGRASKKEHFLNPIMQNKLHIKALKAVIGDDIPVYSVIAFSERCTLKDITVTDSRIKVINRNYISNAISQLSTLTNVDISQSDIDSLTEKLYPFSQVSEEVKEKHINDINLAHKTEQQLPKNELIEPNTELVTSDEKTIEPQASQVADDTNFNENDTEIQDSKAAVDMKCPLCGGLLALRTAKKGKNAGQQFYGCSNYPKCKFIKKV